MRPADLDFAVACTRKEGWLAEAREDFEIFFDHDPAGCFIAVEHNQPAGICIATPYQHFGFVGQLIVLPEHRGAGAGNKLLSAAVDYLHNLGLSQIYLDGVPRAVSLYKRAGFEEICISFRFSGILAGGQVPGIRDMTPADFSQVARLDLEAFGTDRSYFLAQRSRRYPSLCKVQVEESHIVGYIMARRRAALVVVGPWIVSQAARQPENLLLSLCAVYPGDLVHLGVLADNLTAVRMLQNLDLTQRQDPPIRMGLGKAVHLSMPGMCFANGSPAKG